MPVDLLPVEPIALICATMADSDHTLSSARNQLITRIGPLKYQSQVYPFDYTSYYEREMGPGLRKQLFCFEELIDPAQLPHIKLQCMELEKERARSEAGEIRRRVNVDPGLVSIESLVLATTKSSGHRICIAPALYAEITLLFQKGRYAPLPWSYADYQAKEAQQFLMEIRAWLMGRRRGSPADTAS